MTIKFADIEEWRESMSMKLEGKAIDCPDCEGSGIVVEDCECCGQETDRECGLCNGKGYVVFSCLDASIVHGHLSPHRYHEAIMEDADYLARAAGKDKYEVLAEAGFHAYMMVYFFGGKVRRSGKVLFDLD